MSLRGYWPVLQTQEEKDAQTARQFAEAAKSAEEFNQAAAEHAEKPRTVGRPSDYDKQMRKTATQLLVDGARGQAAANRLAPAEQVPVSAEEAAPAKKKRKYQNWWRPPFSFMIIDRVARMRSFQGAIDSLQREHPKWFKGLSKQTISHWYEQQPGKLKNYTQLLPQFERCARDGSSFGRPYNGSRAFLADYPQQQEQCVFMLKALREAGLAINTITTRSVIRGVLQSQAPQVLAANGGGLYLSKAWVRLFMLTNLDWSYRKGTSQAQKLHANYVQLVLDMNQRIAIKAYLDKVEKSLVYSMDETFMLYTPTASSSTFEVQGSKTVGIVGTEDKRGCTLLVSSKPDGTLLPFQLIFAGKSARSLPNDAEVVAAIKAGGHSMTCTPSHWTTEDSLQLWVEQIVVPDYKKVCADLNRETGKQRAVLHNDLYSVHISEGFLGWLYKKYPYLDLVLVPGGCTGIAQVADMVLNRPIKHRYKQLWADETAASVQKQIEAANAAVAAGESPHIKAALAALASTTAAFIGKEGTGRGRGRGRGRSGAGRGAGRGRGRGRGRAASGDPGGVRGGAVSKRKRTSRGSCRKRGSTAPAARGRGTHGVRGRRGGHGRGRSAAAALQALTTAAARRAAAAAEGAIAVDDSSGDDAVAADVAAAVGSKRTVITRSNRSKRVRNQSPAAAHGEDADDNSNSGGGSSGGGGGGGSSSSGGGGGGGSEYCAGSESELDSWEEGRDSDGSAEGASGDSAAAMGQETEEGEGEAEQDAEAAATEATEQDSNGAAAPPAAAAVADVLDLTLEQREELPEGSILGAAVESLKLNTSAGHSRNQTAKHVLEVYKQMLPFSKDLIIRGYEKAGTLQAWHPEFQRTAIGEQRRLFPGSRADVRQVAEGLTPEPDSRPANDLDFSGLSDARMSPWMSWLSSCKAQQALWMQQGF